MARKLKVEFPCAIYHIAHCGSGRMDTFNNTAEAITNVVYNDETPAVTYTYNRLGQQLSATSSVSTNTFVYSPVTLELDYELQNGAKIDRSTDSLGRNAGYALFSSLDSVNPVQEIVYGYSDNGRFASVTSTNSQLSIINSQFI